MPNLAKIVVRSALSVAATCAACLKVEAGERVAVFPFELMDSTQEEELYPKVRPEETARLVRLTDDLKSRLTATKRFEVAPLDTIAGDVEKQAPLFKCNGCEADLAKKSGADIAMLGLVQKFSETLLSVNIEVMDAKSGKVTATYSAGVQGNTDEDWLRAVRYIVKNKIATEGAAP